MSGPDGLCTFFNKPWLDFTGRSMESEIGNGWAEGVHPDDREACVNQYRAAFEARRSVTLDYRLLRQDGVYHWILHQGIPRYGPDGSFLGYVGSCIDISDRKDAENRLRQLNIHIVQVQEAERARIAQELHDDLAQRTAMISMTLDQISRKHKDNARLQNEVHELQQSAMDLGMEITMSGMAERMKNVGGTLSIHSDPGKGTTVTATVPIAKAMRATK
jgi:PAS domain S-box-containing protein